MRERQPTIAVAALLLCAAFAASEPVAAQGPTPLNPEISATLEAARALLLNERYVEAIERFKKAEKLASGRCFDCRLGLATAYSRLGEFKKATSTAHEALRLARDAMEQASAYNQLGIALVGRAGDRTRELEEAEEAFSQARELSRGGIPAMSFNLGEVLLRLGRDSEGIPLLRDFLAREPSGATGERARALIENPRRARESFAPTFSVVTLEGQRLSLADLKGKVVLLDFWATWCPPCVEAVASLKLLNEQFADQPFLLLGISRDHDRQSLERFVVKNRIGWPQYWDEHGEITHRLFNINAFPTFLLVDHDGVIVHSSRGWSRESHRELMLQISRALRRTKEASGSNERS